MNYKEEIDNLIQEVKHFLNKTSLKYPEESYEKIYKIELKLETIKNLSSDADKLMEIKNLLVDIKALQIIYGIDYKIMQSNPEFATLLSLIDSINDNMRTQEKIKILEEFSYSKTNIIRLITGINITFNADEAKNNSRSLEVLQGIKTMFENKSIREMLSDEELYQLYYNYLLVIENNYSEDICFKVEQSLKSINEKVWNKFLTNPLNYKSGNDFKFLIHNFYDGSSLSDCINGMENFRNNRVSCSLITDECVSMYGYNRRIGLIYPNSSEIIISGKKDLYSYETEGKGVLKNKEFSSTLLTPFDLEKASLQRTIEKGQDFDYSFEYNEVVVDSSKTKPCALYYMGYGEKNINLDYNELKEISAKMNIPIVEIDMTIYRNKQGLSPLSDRAKEYIASCVIKNYFAMGKYLTTEEQVKLLKYVENYKGHISEEFLKLKASNELSIENMNNVFQYIIENNPLEDITRE